MDDKIIFEKKWLLASVEQRKRFQKLLSSYPAIEWSFKEKRYLLWLCQLDIVTFDTFEIILNKLHSSI
ncbi:hypothetical protein [Enterococcus casseliflavus]|uniref:hypothetical protein n=1 Tax=Enterococcus casseliflavus TaxID=37734 RepID=UPI0034D1CD55